MLVRTKIIGSTVLLGIGLIVAGCTPLATRSDGRPGLFARKANPSDEGPPQPAPALYIPAKPVTEQAPLVATLPPVDPIPATANVLPLRAPSTDSIINTSAPLPAQAAAPQSPDPANPVAPLRELYQRAAQKIASMDSYTLRLRRREVVGNQSRPEEILLFKFRRDPWSVYFKWLGNEGKGREVVYVKGRYENALHTFTAAGDVPFLPAGRHLKVNPDGVLVKSKSRYAITEAGLGVLVERFGKLVDALEKGDGHEGTAKYLGQLKRPEYENKVDAVLQTIPPKSDPNLPRGGQRLWFFDPNVQLPMLIITQDETGREVEYYCHDRFMFPVSLTDDDFNPEVLWKSATPPKNER